MSANTRTLAATAMVLALAGAAGCTSDTSKAGGAAPPLTLRVGTDDSQGRPAADQIEEFARHVAELSDGALAVEPVWDAVPKGPDWDQRVARSVQDGDLDMGLIPSRAWDTEGVTSFRALNAPFLITSDALLAEVLTSSLAADMLTGLDGTGVVGLSMFPEGLRHPFGFAEPLLGPDDYTGKTIRTPRSDTVAAVYAALGASVTDAEADPAAHAGIESSYYLGPDGVATGNVTLFPKVNVLVANEDAMRGLSSDQRQVLEEAALRTRDRSIEELPDDAEAARIFCDDGGTVVLAEEADVTALRKATAPVYADLERDPQTASFISAIRGMPVSPAAEVEACGGATVPGEGTGTVPDPQALEGVYRFEVSEEELRDAGMRDEAGIRENVGLYTWTWEDGTWCFEQQTSQPVENPEDCGSYEVDGNRLVMLFPDGSPEAFGWEVQDDGGLLLTPVRRNEPVTLAWSAEPWVRIGDVD